MEVGSEVPSHARASHEQHEAIEGPGKIAHGKEGPKHHEGMDLVAWKIVGGLSQGQLPGKMKVSHVSAQIIDVGATDPIDTTAASDQGILGCRQEVPREHQHSLKQAESQDEPPQVHLLLALQERTGDEVREERLEANVQKANHGEHAIDGIVALIDEEVLHVLQQFHQDKVDGASCGLLVASLHVGEGGEGNAVYCSVLEWFGTCRY